MSGPKIIDAPSPNWDERKGSADMIVLHYTGMASGEAALRKLRDPAPKRGAYAAALPAQWAKGDPDEELGRASAHYLVEEDGRVFALVPEDKRAWHAGRSWWAGECDVNSRSVGVEIVNGGHDFGLPDFAEAQIAAVVALCQDIAARRAIPPWRVVAHSDIAPGRKADPGERFPWETLERGGVALGGGAISGEPGMNAVLFSLGAAGEGVGRLQRRLQAFGYGLAESRALDERTGDVIAAFQSRFARPYPEPRQVGVWRAADDAALGRVFARAASLAVEGGPPPPADPG